MKRVRIRILYFATFGPEYLRRRTFFTKCTFECDEFNGVIQFFCFRAEIPFSRKFGRNV